MSVGQLHGHVQALRKKTMHTAAGLGKQDTPYGDNMGETAILGANHRFEQELMQGCALMRVGRKDTVAYLQRRLEQMDATDIALNPRSFARDVAVAVALSTIGLVGRFMPVEELMSGARLSKLNAMIDRNLPVTPDASLGQQVRQWQQWLDPESRKN